MSTAIRIRWGDNDRYFGPFTYHRDERGYRPAAVTIGTGNSDEDPRCRIRLSAFGHTLIIATPPIVKPERRWVDTSRYEWSKGPGSGYWDSLPRQYGLSYGEGYLQVFYGRQTHDSSTEQNWGWFPPWTQWRHVRHTLYGVDGALFAELPHRWRFGTPEYDLFWRLNEECPTRIFAFRDFDGEALTATTKIEEREWRFGTKWCAWLSLFRKPKVRRSLDIQFSGETGRRKGSWKGGTIGHSINMTDGELHESAFRRYCAAHDMIFVGTIPSEEG